MTKEEILSMPAGPEMDALVAERVMGLAGPFGWSAPPEKGEWRHINSRLLSTREEGEAARLARGYAYGASEPAFCRWRDGWGPVVVDEYSTDIAAAWEVVERLRENPWDTITVHYDAGEYSVTLFEDAGRTVEYASCESSALAICRAALLSTAERLSE